MFSIEIDDRAIKALHPIKLRDISAPLHAFAALLQAETDLMFSQAGGPGSALSGGEARGVKWEPLSQKYKKRPSGARVSPASALLQDTGTLRQLAAHEIVRFTPTSMVLGTRLVYASAQNKKRPFLFITEADGDKFLTMLNDYAEKTLDGKAL
jgi:hypothetical protein